MTGEGGVLPGGAEPEDEVAFRRLVLGLADTKRMLGIRYSDWLLGAPSIEAGIAASSMAQDEWGHARLLYASLKDLGDDPTELEHRRDEAAYASWDPLDEPLPDWAHLIAGVVVLDGALSVAFEGLLEGEYTPLHGRLRKMLGEEEFHAVLGRAWLRRLAETRGRVRLEKAAAALLPLVTACLAPGDAPHARLVRLGLVPAAEEMRARMAGRLDPLLAHLGLEVPVGVGLPEGWDLGRGRGPGHPATEAVERARGDRNRTLFVE